VKSNTLDDEPEAAAGRSMTAAIRIDPPLPMPRGAQLCRALHAGPVAQIHGRIAALSGASIEVEGLAAPVGSLCRIRTAAGGRLLAQAIGFRGPRTLLALFDEGHGLAAGDRVEWIAHGVRVGVGPQLRGRVVDALGRPIDGRPLPLGLDQTRVDGTAPGSLQRPPIRQPLETGVRVIDGMLTCGVGQRLGIFAGSGVGKSSLLGMLTRGVAADAIVIGLVGERGREVREFIDDALGEEGMRRAVLVVATSDQPATMRLQAAWTATAIAESLRDSGQDVLLMVDSVTRFALAQRELGLAAGEPPTTRGYPPSVFSLLPRLVERAGRTDRGAITAFYSVLVEGDDTNEPISDTLRGLLDGHIVLSRRLAAESHWPAVDVLHSLSRLQNQLLEPAEVQAAQQVRRWLSEYDKASDLIDIGAYRSGANPELDRAMQMRPAILRFLQQAMRERGSLAATRRTLLQLAAGPAQAGGGDAAV
jgi:flagellum-specific ATP synthase